MDGWSEGRGSSSACLAGDNRVKSHKILDEFHPLDLKKGQSPIFYLSQGLPLGYITCTIKFHERSVNRSCLFGCSQTDRETKGRDKLVDMAKFYKTYDARLKVSQNFWPRLYVAVVLYTQKRLILYYILDPAWLCNTFPASTVRVDLDPGQAI